jgi:TolA-binding protein
LIDRPAREARADAAEDYSVAAGFYKRSRWDLSSDGFRKFLAAYPKHEKATTARLFLGLSLVNLKDYQGAREALRQFVKDGGDNRNLPHAMYRVAECSFLLDDLKSAEPELAAFIAKFPEDQLVERALPYLGEVQLRLNKPEGAVQSYQKALKLFPESTLADESRFGLARSFEMLKKLPEATELYRQVAANPAGVMAPQAQLNLGALYFDGKDYAASSAAYAKLLQQFPQSPLAAVAHLNRGYALYQAGDYRQAVTEFDAAAAEKKQAAEATLWKGLSLKSLSQYPEAVAVFKGAFEAQPDQPLAESLLYHWADTEQRRGELSRASELFLDLVKRWPKGELADDSLHLAALATFDAGQKAETEALLNRFAAEYPQSGLRWHEEILRGRLDLLNGAIPQATQHFERVLRDSESESTKSWARLYLGHALHQQGKQAEALAATEPLAALVEKTPQDATFSAVYLLRATCFLALGRREKPTAKGQVSAEARQQFAAAADAAARYLAKNPRGEQKDHALALRAVAAACGGYQDAAKNDLELLRKEFPQSRHLEQTVYDLAEVAYANDDWDWSTSLFGTAAGNAQSPLAVRALSGLGWSQYKRKMYPEATATFAKVVAEHPQAPLAAESGFMQAKSLQDGGKPAEAVPVYQAVLEKYAPSDFAFSSGLQAARLLGELNQIKAADAAYAELLKKFAAPKNLDKLLDEWALMNYTAQDFARADEIFRRLVKEAPDSDLADNARLSLAESDLLAGKVDPAQMQFQALQADSRSDPEVQQTALFQLIGIALERQQWKELREDCRQLSTRFPEGKHRWYAELHWAEADLNLQDLAAARERLLALKGQQDQPAVKGAKWFPQVWILLAETEFRRKEYPAVAAAVAEFRKSDPQSNLLYVAEETLGRSLKAQALFPQAREAFKRVTQDPAGRRTETAAKSQFMIAETYLLEKDVKTAEEEYLKVEILYKFPEWQAPALYQAATCQEQLNRWSAAVASYESLIKQFPESQYAAMAKERLPTARKKITAG